MDPVDEKRAQQPRLPETPMGAGWSTKWAVASVVGAALLWRRDAFMLLYLAGGAAATISAKTLKLVLKQARPVRSPAPSPPSPPSPGPPPPPVQWQPHPHTRPASALHFADP